MKNMKNINEFFKSGIGKNKIITYDFSPRRGTLYVVKDNKISSFYFHEAYRLVLDYLGKEQINSSFLPSEIINNIVQYVNNKTSTLTQSQQIGQIKNDTLSDKDILILNLIKKLPNSFWTELNYNTKLINVFLNNHFKNTQMQDISNIIFLNELIFYYDGFTLDLKSKKWTPPKEQNLREVNNQNFKMFFDYKFQKEYLKNNPELIFNFPKEMLDNKIQDEYNYIIQSNKYNL